MPRSKHGQVLGPVDSAFYYVDSPQTPMNIGALTFFEGKIPFDPLRRMLDARIHQIPIYQQKLVQAPLNLGQPTWVYDPDFNIAKHVYWHELPAPGDEHQLQDMAGRLVSGMLDRSKPLWEIHLIEGLQGDRTAILFKIHHCMVDGLAAIDLFTLLFDLTPNPSPIPRKPVYDPPPMPSQPQLVVDAILQSLPNRWRIVRKIAEDVSTIGSTISDKNNRRKMFTGMANVASDNMQLLRPLPINGTNSGRQTIAWADFSLAEVKAIKSARKVSVNDVMLTILSGAVEAYVRQRGGSGGQDSLRVLVPVSMRSEAEKEEYGNRIAVLPVDIPFNLSDPLERLRLVSEYTTVMKDSSLSTTLDMVLTMPSLAASWLQPLIWKAAPVVFSLAAHMWCTNVAGPQIPMYLLGHRLLNTFGFFPLNPSMGLATVIASYNQRIAMTLVADMAIVPEVNDLRNLVYETYKTLRAAAGVPEMEPIVLSRTRTEKTEKIEKPESVPAKASASSATSDPERIETRESVTTVEIADGSAALSEGYANGQNGQPTTERSEETEASESASGDAFDQETPTLAQEEKAEKPRLFTDGWAKGYMKAINASESYRRASTRWEAGSLAFVLHATPEEDYPEAVAVILDLHKGECRAARALTPAEAKGEAAFVIEGDFATWSDVLKGKAAPLALIMRGKLRLVKGSMPRLLPFTQSAQELLNCAKNI
ncbi:MAG TPA: wax ester/triacylglycerol synthase family O-acyltransferase [Aggregatilineales bacterium]|nr:wax ester/triacylglycerol synthase family O-acyltransferase [Anaerolineales bacterium]HRE46726.1 wax ester/triacylglycerol synthase family O-acyltransferase [Aggregatilineales bacterium]